MAGKREGQRARPKYRDNDDQRDYLTGEDRAGIKPDSRSEAKGDARDAVGNTARDTAADPTGPERNDRTKLKPEPDQFDADLRNDSESRR